MATALADAAVGRAAGDLIDSAWRQLGYIWNYNSNVAQLQKRLQILRAEADGVRRQLAEATSRGEQIEEIAKSWLTNADTAIQAADEILRASDAGAKQICFNCCVPDLKTRYLLSKRAMKETLPAFDELRRDKVFDRVSISYLIPVQELNLSKDYEIFESRTEILEEIVGALRNSDVRLIGLYGLGGVGKSTLLKRIAARVKEEDALFKVAKAEVTQTPDITEIQKQLAEWLGLKFDVDSPELRAGRLIARLKLEEKVLIILDDVWERITLADIGIPDDHKGCKILISSRSQSVLFAMEVSWKFMFFLQVLNEEEAIYLFRKKAGALEHPEMEYVLFELASRCGGLPLLIEPVATALRGKEMFEWKNALDVLKSFDDGGPEAKVYKALELSFKFLEKDAKSLFIFCAQIRPHRIYLSDLLKYSVGLSLFNQCSTVELTRNRLLTVVSELKKSCLLVAGDSNNLVKMHDVVHNFATSIAVKEHQVFSVARATEMEEWPDNDALRLCTAISLPYCKIPPFPEVLNCPGLVSFMLYNNDPSLRIPFNSFSRMTKLKLLDLSNVNLSPLLLSFETLGSLQTLCLDRCAVKDIRAIAKLKNLQVLSLIESNIVALPRELRALTHLRLLDINGCRRLERIPANVIGSWMKLEDLYMGNSFVQWDGENASLAELKLLSNLVNLEIHVLDPMILHSDFFSPKLERFRIFVGGFWSSTINYENSRILQLKTVNLQNQVESVKTVLMKTEELYLDDVKGVKNIVPELDWQGFSRLKHLNIQNCDKIQFIIDWKGTIQVSAFSRLESLFLHSLSKLEKINSGLYTTGYFQNLKKLNIRNCSGLKNLFPLSAFKCLVQLQEIIVSNCETMEEIVASGSEEESEEIIMATELQKITLENLPRFRTFCSPVTQATDQVSSAATLFIKKIQFPYLAEMNLSSINVERIWLDEMPPFNRLRVLTVEGCGNLAYVMKYSMVGSLTHLKHIEISNCESMKEVIRTEGAGEEVILPKLDFLKLKDLPQLVQLITSTSIEFPSLAHVSVQNCPRLQSVPSVPISKACLHRQMHPLNAADTSYTSSGPSHKTWTFYAKPLVRHV